MQTSTTRFRGTDNDLASERVRDNHLAAGEACEPVKGIPMKKPLLVLIGVLCALGPMPFTTKADGPPDVAFRDFVPEFIAAWDQRDREKLNGFIDPSLGLWVIYNIGIAPIPYHFHSLDEPLGQGEHGFGYLGGTGFGDCQPKPGSPPPKCDEEGISEGNCRFGRTEPTFNALFDDQVLTGSGQPEEMARLRRERDAVKLAAGESVFFLSDAKWGAVFYFTRSKNRWILFVVDTSDCSA